MNPFFKILAYHSINSKENRYIYSRNITDVKDFANHIKFISKNYSAIPLYKMVKIIQDREITKGKYISITFDDGYADFLNFAYPILRMYKIPATLFLSTDYMENGDAKWDDKLQFAKRSFADESAFINWFNSNVLFKKIKSFVDLTWHLQRSANEKIQEVIDQIYQRCGLMYKQRTMMTWDEVKELSKDELISFGSHTCSHSNLTVLDKRRALHEIRRSKDQIQLHTLGDVTGFCYPYGLFNEVVKSLVKEEEIEFAVTCNYGFNTNNTDLLELKRVLADNFSLKYLRRQLSSLRYVLKKIKSNVDGKTFSKTKI